MYPWIESIGCDGVTIEQVRHKDLEAILRVRIGEQLFRASCSLSVLDNN